MLTVSEFFDDVPRGTMRAGVRCEDVQRLTFDDAGFDLVTHTEVFEHVPGDMAGFRELRRVLRPGGVMAFTVPLMGDAPTRERAMLHSGTIMHLLPPTYHSDRLRGAGQVLCFRDYGCDIVDRLHGAPINIPGSRFLRPYDPRLRHLDPLRVHRMQAEMTRAATQGHIYHLWWHPHNFGVHTSENLLILDQLLEHASMLRRRSGFRSMNMGELAAA